KSELEKGSHSEAARDPPETSVRRVRARPSAVVHGRRRHGFFRICVVRLGKGSRKSLVSARNAMMDPVVVSHRVDALTLAYRVLLSDKVTREFRSRGAIAREHGRAAYTDTAGADWELKVPRRGDGQIWRLRREDHVRLQIDPKARGGKRELVDVLEPVPLDYENAGSARVTGVVGKVGWQNTGDLGVVEEPGWTIELVWYASLLADMPLALVVRGGRADATR